MKNTTNLTSKQKSQIMSQDQLETFKSIYYLIKGKRDSEVKLYDGDKQFCKDDILELHDEIARKMNNHRIETFITQTSVALDSKEIEHFGTWQQFLDFNWNISPCTDYIALEWDFNLILPNQPNPFPQTYNLKIRIGRGLRPNEFLHLMVQGGDEFELEKGVAQMVLKIDFVNTIISNELKMIVDRWYEALQKNQTESKIYKFFGTRTSFFGELITIFYLIGGVTFVKYLTEYWFKNYHSSEIYEYFTVGLICILLFYCFFIWGRRIASRILESTIRKLKKNPLIILTKGDKNRLQNIKSKNNSFVGGFTMKFFISLSVSIVIMGIGELLKYFGII